MLVIRWVFALSTIVLAIFPHYIYATNKALPTITIALNEIPGVLSKDRVDLPYNEVFLALENSVSFNIEFRFDPAHRASANFNYNETDCLFPASLSSSRYSPVDKIESEAINMAKAYFIAKQVIDSEQMVTDKSKKYLVGYKRGNSFGKKIELLKHHTLLPLNSISQAARMLNRGRIEVIIAYMPDSIAVLQDEENASLKYSDRSFFHSQGDRVLCHLSSRNKQFINEVDKTILSLKESGELKKLLGPAFIE